MCMIMDEINETHTLQKLFETNMTAIKFSNHLTTMPRPSKITTQHPHLPNLPVQTSKISVPEQFDSDYKVKTHILANQIGSYMISNTHLSPGAQVNLISLQLYLSG